MLNRRMCLALLVACCGASSAAEEQVCFGPGDLTTDGCVKSDDYLLFEECLAGPDLTSPPPGCALETFLLADLQGDGDVDLGDFAGFTQAYKKKYFFYGPHRDNLEAEMLAMDLSGELRAPDTEYERILRDLALIRAEYDKLQTVIDDMDYAPDQLLVSLYDGVPTDEYDALNEHYQLVDEEVHTSFRLLTFCDHLNAPLLAGIYAAAPEVKWADPNSLLGTDDRIVVADVAGTYRYEIDDGWLDCFDGCDCHRVWTIDVDAAGVVTLVDVYEWGMPYCDFDR